MRTKDGKFAKGNPGGALKKPNELIELRNNSATLILKKFFQLMNLTLREFEELAQNPGRLTVRDATFIKFFTEAMKRGDVQRMKFIFDVARIPTDLKAIAIQDLNSLVNETEDDGPKVVLSVEDKLLMLDRAKQIILDNINE